MRRLSLCIIVAVVILSGCQRDISGTYLASDKASVAWLQLVRTPDNHLTGQLALSSLKSDGTIDRRSTSLNGAVDGENVTLSGSKFLGFDTFTLSGVLRGGTLTLSGGDEPTPIIFKRATLSDYQAQASELNASSQGILNAKAAIRAKQRIAVAETNFVSEIDRLIGNMQRFDSAADVHLGRFPGAEKDYQAITAKVASYVERERQLASNQNASIARSQLYVDANQASFATDQLHNQGEMLQSALESNVKPLADEVSKMGQICAVPTPSLSPAQNEERSASCNRLSGAAPQFRQKFDAMSAGLTHLEQVYQRERNAQQELLRSAQRLER